MAQDIPTLISVNLFKKPDVIFYVVRPFQETYFKSTLSFLPDLSKVLIVRAKKKGNADGSWDQLPSGVYYHWINPVSLKFLKTKVFVTPETAKNYRGLPRATYRVHIPHSPVSLHMIYPQNSFMGFNVIFAAGQHHINEFKAMHNDLVKVFEVGYGRLDYLKSFNQQTCDSNNVVKATVVIAPSWHKGNFLEVIGLDLILILLELNYRVVLRPHYKIAELTPNLLTGFNLIADENKNLIIDIAGADCTVMFNSDLMISDYSGVAYEYAMVTDKPVLFVNSKPKVRNENWRDIGLEPMEIESRSVFGLVASVDPVDITDKIADLLSSNQSGEKGRPLRDRDFYFFNANGKVAPVMSRSICELVEECK